MTKYILRLVETDYATYSFETFIPFEYENKEKFCYDSLCILDKWKKLNRLSGYTDNYSEYKMALIQIFEKDNYLFSPFDIENFEKNIFSLEEWFEKEKNNAKLKK